MADDVMVVDGKTFVMCHDCGTWVRDSGQALHECKGKINIERHMRDLEAFGFKKSKEYKRMKSLLKES